MKLNEEEVKKAELKAIELKEFKEVKHEGNFAMTIRENDGQDFYIDEIMESE